MASWGETLAAWGNHVARWVGERTGFGAESESSSATSVNASQEDVFESVADIYPLHSILPYEAYDEQDQLFINKKSMGFMLEAFPLVGSNDETEQILASILTDIIPPEADLQVWLWASPKVGPILNELVGAVSVNDDAKSNMSSDLKWLAEERIRFFEKGINQSLLKSDTFLVRNFQLLFSVSLPKSDVKQEKNLKKTLTEIRQSLQSSLKSIQLATSPMKVETFLSMMSDWINVNTDLNPSNISWNPYDSLHLQITDPEYRYRVFRNHLRCESENESMEVRCFSVREFPNHMAQLNMRDAIGHLFNTALQLPCPFWVTLAVRGLDFEKSRSRAQMKYINRDSASRSPLAKFNPLLSKEQQDWSFVRNRLLEGDRLVQTFFQVVIADKPETAGASERKLQDLYRANGWKLKKENGLQFQSWMALFPMMMTEGLFQDLKILGRIRTMTAFNATMLMPLQGEWKGTQKSGLLLPGRRGQLAWWNPFDNPEGNYNVAIAAKSGSGKSMFTQEYIRSVVSSGGRVWVIDVGRSYQKTCDFFRGEFIEFRPDKSISLNPFTTIVDFDEALELLKPLAAAMVRPSSQVSDEEMAFLEKALKSAWNSKRNEATISDVSDHLQSMNNSLCNNLSHLLYPYTKEGMYGRYFDGPCSIVLDNPLIVLELEELKAKKDLQKLVLLVLMYQISQQMYLGNRSQQKSCIIDEAWDLLSGDNEGAARFIETGYRKARRYNANFVTVTQSINDYFKNATSLAAYENSDNNVILSQKSESIEQLKGNKRLSLDDFSEKLFKSVRKTDEYSECVIKGPSGLSVHRILFDPFSRILYSSKGEEFEHVKRLQAQGMSIREATTQVARKFSEVE